MKVRNALAFTALLLATPIAAFAATDTCAIGLRVNFDEGAPVDRFIMANVSETNIGPSEIEFDLRPSAGKLVFDTQSGGVEVFQPFQSASTTLDVADGADCADKT